MFCRKLFSSPLLRSLPPLCPAAEMRSLAGAHHPLPLPLLFIAAGNILMMYCSRWHSIIINRGPFLPCGGPGSAVKAAAGASCCWQSWAKYSTLTHLQCVLSTFTSSNSDKVMGDAISYCNLPRCDYCSVGRSNDGVGITVNSSCIIGCDYSQGREGHVVLQNSTAFLL